MARSLFVAAHAVLLLHVSGMVVMHRAALALSLQDVIAMCADVAMKFLHKSSEPITGLDTSGGHS